MVVVLAPEYLPGCAFVAMMRRADCLVLADTYQYSRQSYHNRARVRTPQGWQWLSVPLVGGQHGRPILETEIDNRTPWQERHTRSIRYNYSSAPFYDYYIDPLNLIMKADWNTLGDLCSAGIDLLAKTLAPGATIKRASRMAGAPASLSGILDVLGRGDVLLSHARYRQDSAFVSDPYVATFELPPYSQNFPGYEPDLSVIDLLFACGPDAGSRLDAGLNVKRMRRSC
jgi:WbqC-like protein family